MTVFQLSPESHKHLKKLPIQERSRATVGAILQATAQLLLEAPPEGLTTQQIAAKAGVSVGSMYQYFDTKEAVFVTLATDTVAKLSSVVRDILANIEGEDVSQAIPLLVDAMLIAHEKHPERIGFLVEHLLNHGNLAVLDANSMTLEQWLEEYFLQRNYAPPEVTRFRVRIAVRGVSALLRSTLRYSPQDLRSRTFRDELIRFLHGMLTGRFAAEQTKT